MQERHAVLGVHHEIDVLAGRNPGAVDVVSGLVPCYDRGAVGWSVEFERLLRDAGKTEPGVSAFPDVDVALDHFVEAEPSTVWHSVQRLLVLTAVSRVSPRHQPGGTSAALVQRALERFVGESRDTKMLHRELATSDALQHDTWHVGIAELVAAGHLQPEFVGVAAPCTGELVPVTIGGDTDPVAVLSTVYQHHALTVADLEPTLLDPTSWPSCDDFWCVMDKESTSGPFDTYLEEVAGDCANWRIVTRLIFCKRDFGDGSTSLDYWLADDQTSPCDGLVQVDEGSILVEPLAANAPGVRVSTTKRLRFRGPMDGAQLAMTACALGWDGAGEQFVFGCTSPGSSAKKAGGNKRGANKRGAGKRGAKQPTRKKPAAKKPAAKKPAKRKPVAKKASGTMTGAKS